LWGKQYLGYGAVYRRAHERDQLVASMIKAGAPLCVPPDKADALPKPMHLACATRSVPKRRLAEGRFLARAIQSRMFAPLHGVFEDPATGSANVALIGLLAHLRAESSLRLKAAIGQGVDLGRPSLPRAVAEKVDGAVAETFIGGGCKPVMSGWIDLQ
jgi:trans-2,3-dihydro-3-hydroxyanthranilate isomerase